MTQADRIRDFVKSNYIDPARAKGQDTVSVRSGDVHFAMSLSQRYPAVCSALGSNKFEQLCNIERLSIEGPINGANTVYTYRLL